MRDIRVHPILFIGCIGPAFLCLFICGLVLFIWFQPHLTWLHGAEMKTALDHYEQVRAAVFSGEAERSALEQVATGFHLETLQDWLDGSGDSFLPVEPANVDPVVISFIREYEADCGVVILDQYHGRQEVAVELHKIDSSWKVEQITPHYNAGITGVLPLRVCV